MLALVSAEVTRGVTEVLLRMLGWKTVQVATVASALEEMSDGEKERVVSLVVEADPVAEDVISQLPYLELIACLRGNPVNVDLEAATKHGVPVAYTPGRNAASVADFTLGLLLAATRNLAIAHHGVVSRELTVDTPEIGHLQGDVIWRAKGSLPSLDPYRRFIGPELSSLIVTVIGFGDVGRAVADRLSGLVAQVVVVDPSVEPAEIAASGYRPMALDDALTVTDVVSLHAKSSTEIIGSRELALMKPAGYLINTARAPVLDYGALVSALRTGRLRAAALDVFPEEPLPSMSPLLDVPGLTLTPHIAGASESVPARHSEILLRVLPRLYDLADDWAALPVANAEVRAIWKPQSSFGTGAAKDPAGTTSTSHSEEIV